MGRSGGWGQGDKETAPEDRRSDKGGESHWGWLIRGWFCVMIDLPCDWRRLDIMEEDIVRLNDELVSLALTLFDIGAVRFGEFALHSGRISPIYIDLRLLASFPDALRQAAAAYGSILEKMTFDLLAATPLAGLPIGTAISLDINVPLVYARTTAKGYGTGKQIEGKWEVGQRAVMVDDLITSGDSLLRGIKMLESAGLIVSEAVVLLDRQQGGREMLQSQGYTLSSAMTLVETLSVYEIERRITAEQHTRVLESLS